MGINLNNGLFGATVPWSKYLTFLVPPLVSTQGTWAFQPQNPGGTLWFAANGFNSTNAQNDSFSWGIDLSAGTWRVDLWGMGGPNRSIVTVDISCDGGTTWIACGTVDLYSAATAQTTGSFADLIIPSSGKALLRLQALSRNGAASGWYMTVQACQLSRTA